MIEKFDWRIPAFQLTDAELAAHKADIGQQIDDYFAPDEDGEEFEGHGGSPGEWMYERYSELEQEEKRRGR